MKKQTRNTEDKELYLVLLIAAGVSMLPLSKIGRKETNSRKDRGRKDNSRNGQSRNVTDRKVQNRKAPNRKVLNEKVQNKEARVSAAPGEEVWKKESQNEEPLTEKEQPEEAWAGEVQEEETRLDETRNEEKRSGEKQREEALTEEEQREESLNKETKNEKVWEEDWDKEAWDKEIPDEEDWDKEAWDKEIPDEDDWDKEAWDKEILDEEDWDKEAWDKEILDEEDWDKEAWDKEILDEEDWNEEVQNEIVQKEQEQNEGNQTKEDQDKKDYDRISEPEPLSKISERAITKWVQRIASCFYLILVLGICMLPLLAMGVKGQQEETENRTLTSLPELFDEEGFQWDYLSKMGEYFDEHFAFRSELVSLDAWVRTTVFGVSPVSDVIVGEDGWLYYTATLDDFQHKNPASDRMLFNIAHNISLMQRYTESLGMDFLFTVAPNKNSLYKENMPLRLMYQVEEQSDMDRLLYWLDKERVNYVDLFSLFGEQEEILYYQKDSHWNRKGAVMVYNALLDACGKEHETYENSRTQIVNDYYGDLNRMLFPIGGEPERDIYYMGGNEWVYSEGETVEDSLIITESAEGSQTLLMYRDSFGNTLLPLLAGEYSQAVFSKRVPYTMTDLAIYWPDVVIVEKVERHLPTFAEVPPLMSAPVIMLEGEQIAVESNTTLGLTKEGSYWNFFGTADMEYISTNSRIFVEITDADGTRVYEAFCVSYSDDGLSDNGFTLYISEIVLSGDLLNVKVMTQRDSEILVLMEDEINLING